MTSSASSLFLRPLWGEECYLIAAIVTGSAMRDCLATMWKYRKREKEGSNRPDPCTLDNVKPLSTFCTSPVHDRANTSSPDHAFTRSRTGKSSEGSDERIGLSFLA
ncbi:hypothetical protein PM082_004179 [Marasmius tenuissimus]|nr:hypothetical protein PM082_004179 [Marasmius tenuissimus]